MLSQMPLPPSNKVNDAYFYVQAPWIKDLSIIPILLSYDIRDEIIELIGDMDSQIVVDTSVYKTNLP